MTPFTPEDIKRAAEALADGNREPWEEILGGIRRGQLRVEVMEKAIAIRIVPPGHELGEVLSRYRALAGSPTYEEIAQAVGVSETTVGRILHGEVISTWPTIQAVIRYFNGPVQDVRTLWLSLKESRDN